MSELGQTETQDEAAVASLLAIRSTRSTMEKVREIPDSSVKLVSARPDKIEGLVHSGSREIWHYASLRSKDGASCSCESWKYQGVRRHRLCKHLIKFAQYALDNEETKPYAVGVILQSLRGLEVYDELEKDRLIVRDKEGPRCTELGRSMAVLGVPVRDAKKVVRALSDSRSDLKTILESVVLTQTEVRKEVVKRVLDRLPAKSVEEIISDDDMPGIIENCLEELEYVNSILLKLIDAKHSARKKSETLQENLVTLLESMR